MYPWNSSKNKRQYFVWLIGTRHDGLRNTGKDCWQGCSGKQGKCEWCGERGKCCRKGLIENECDGLLGIEGRGNVCVGQSRTGIFN